MDWLDSDVQLDFALPKLVTPANTTVTTTPQQDHEKIEPDDLEIELAMRTWAIDVSLRLKACTLWRRILTNCDLHAYSDICCKDIFCLIEEFSLNRIYSL